MSNSLTISYNNSQIVSLSESRTIGLPTSNSFLTSNIIVSQEEDSYQDYNGKIWFSFCEGQPVGVGNPTTAEAFSAIAYPAYTNNSNNSSYGVVSCEQDTYCFAVLGTNSITLYVATKNNTVFTMPRVYYSLIGTRPSQYNASIYDTSTCLYAAQMTNSVSPANFTIHCPVFATQADGLAAVAAYINAIS